MAFFAKRAKKATPQRVKRDASGSEDETPAQSVSVVRKKVCVDSDEDDAEAFQVKKSKLSRKMDKEKEKWSKEAQANQVKTQSMAAVANPGQSFGKRTGGGSKKRPSWKDDYTEDAGKLLEDSLEGDVVSITEDMMQEEPVKDGEESDVEVVPSAAEPWENAAEQAKNARAQKRRLSEIANELGEDVVPTEVIPRAGEKYGAPLTKKAVPKREFLVPPGSTKADEIKKDATFSIVMPQDDDDEWELSQMKLALGGKGRTAALNRAQGKQPAESSSTKQVPSKTPYERAAPTPLVAPGTKLLNPTEALARLKKASQQLAGGFQDRQERMDDLEEQCKEASAAIERFSAEQKTLEGCHKMLLDTEDLVFCLSGLLDEKKGRLEKAIETLSQIEKELAAKQLHQRRREISHDMLMAGAQLTQALSDSEPENEKNQEQKQKMRKRRSKRQRQREGFSRVTDKGGEDKSQHEGWATSDSSDDAAEYAGDRAAFCEAAWKQIFSDVDEEFVDISCFMESFGELKKKLRQDYVKAHLPLSLPDMAFIYVGFSLLWWDPLRMTAIKDSGEKWGQKWGPRVPEFEPTLEKFTWFDKLAEFSEVAGDTDPDADLVPCVVRRYVFPEVKRRLLDCWDVSSRSQTEAVVALLDECLLFESEEKTAESFAELLTAVHQRLEEGIAALVPQALFGDDRWWPSHARMRLLWRACKIADNALLLDERLPDETLAAVLITSLLAQRILPAIKAPRVDLGELEVIEFVIGLIPSKCFENGLPPALAPLRVALGPKAPHKEGADKTVHRAAKILQQLKCFDEAQALLQQI
eukprot:gnl/MRDRNA2_/MRDRNA2_112699_c0_seq1.p1 gnl/MRDRNA2_/MRDRNA2_112699_c0~~gnl/MRDRNA2_/MRDRNA2_112699_c0_seq1.p1  ORF type:complete len:811 (+),score=237.42 gnl/MRDRNA2_/MRDRNA2_112699_c0_seq1:65-2497(+)